MISALRNGRVDGLRVIVACARSLDDVPHDVYLLELADPTAADEGARFDEVPYIECLEPVLESSGGGLPWVVEVTRTHRADRGGLGWAQVSVLLGVGGPPADGTPAPDLTPLMTGAFSRMSGRPESGAQAPARADVLDAAAAAVAHAFPDVDPRALSLTDEEHHADDGCWTVGLCVPGAARFRVQLGLAPALPGSTHVHRMPLGEVVDSIGP